MAAVDTARFLDLKYNLAHGFEHPTGATTPKHQSWRLKLRKKVLYRKLHQLGAKVRGVHLEIPKATVKYF